MKSISKIINSIKNEDWRHLLLGLQENFNITQFNLLKRCEIKRTSKILLWIKGRHKVPTFYKFKFIRFISKNKFNINKLIKFGKLVDKSIKFRNKWIFVKKSLTKKDFTNIKEKRDYLNILKLFPYSKNNKIIYFIPYKNNFIIFYKEKRSTRPHPLIFSKFIKLDKTFLV